MVRNSARMSDSEWVLGAVAPCVAREKLGVASQLENPGIGLSVRVEQVVSTCSQSTLKSVNSVHLPPATFPRSSPPPLELGAA